MKFIKENWMSFIPVGFIFTPFYLGLLRWSLKFNDFSPTEEQLIWSGVLITVTTLTMSWGVREWRNSNGGYR